MNISGLLNYQTIPSVRMMDCGTRGRTSSFGEMLSGAQADQTAASLYLPRDNTVYSGGRGGQTVYAEYTLNSNSRNPVVRIKGVSDSGEYMFTCKINDIDPQNASYAEMCALWGYLKETGQSSIALGYPDTPVLPYGIDVGDVTVKRNYAALIEGMTTSTAFDPSNQRTARDLLDLYQGWRKEITERPATIGDSAPPRFIEGPGYCFANPAFEDWLEEMAPVFEAQRAERLASLPTVHPELDDAQVKELAEKYGGGRMSQEQYDDFLDELVNRGVLTRDEIKYMGYEGWIICSADDGVTCYESDQYGAPLKDANGNSLDWAKKLTEYLSKDLLNAGLFLYVEENGVRPAFEAVRDLLERMEDYTAETE